ncbi:REP-associated tyrosine transposase [Desulfosediminicola flagellatus]|uniref:REP-associated tyrosine transposase n=1 Tax=Desulfosediminicola flagellatus TaxID=2569541 RepID=UPI0010AB9F21|nr:transposase [Desulfosediminicola flagellatus]
MKGVSLTGLPHHVIQRGLDGRKTFFNSEDYSTYLEIISECTRHHNIEILCYCLMPDHVHLIAVPNQKDALSLCLHAVDSRYTKYIHLKTGTTDQVWQDRYASHLLDEEHFITCARYIEINPVKRKYVEQPEEWQWSSARAHIFKTPDTLIDTDRLLCSVKIHWQDFLAEKRADDEADMFYLHEKNGKPLGNDAFLAMIESRLHKENE